MKICKFFLIALLVLPALALCSSHSFLMPRSIVRNSIYELSLTNYDMYYNNKSCQVFNAYGSFFFQKSTKGDKTARYFFPNNKSSLSIREDGSGDIGSLWFNIISAPGTYFSSTLCMRPTQTIYGGYLTFRFDGSNWKRGLWADISIVPMKVETDLHLKEINIENPGTLSGFANMTEALNNSEWTAGKFSTSKLSRSGMDDVLMKVGYDHFYNDEESSIGGYIVASAPTGKMPTSKYIFEPIVGSRHWNLGLGLKSNMELCDWSRFDIYWMIDAKYMYGFKGKERRSFDLKANGDWSRYLQVVSQTYPFLSEPGINLLTCCVDVTPRSMLDVWTAFNFAFCNWNLELGYDFWYRQSEKICNPCNPDGKGIFDIAGVCTTPISASGAKISQCVILPNIAPSDTVFTPITESDIKLSSGSNPGAISNTIYGAFSLNRFTKRFSYMLGLGGSYEFGNKNALSNGAVWLRAGIDY